MSCAAGHLTPEIQHIWPTLKRPDVLSARALVWCRQQAMPARGRLLEGLNQLAQRGVVQVARRRDALRASQAGGAADLLGVKAGQVVQLLHHIVGRPVVAALNHLRLSVAGTFESVAT